MDPIFRVNFPLLRENLEKSSAAAGSTSLPTMYSKFRKKYAMLPQTGLLKSWLSSSFHCTRAVKLLTLVTSSAFIIHGSDHRVGPIETGKAKDLVGFKTNGKLVPFPLVFLSALPTGMDRMCPTVGPRHTWGCHLRHVSAAPVQGSPGAAKPARWVGTAPVDPGACPCPAPGTPHSHPTQIPR